MDQKERKNAPTHAGPHESFPLGPGCEHVKSAWDLAGHAANPNKVRGRVRAYAKKHGCSLPDTASEKKSVDLEDMFNEEFHAALHSEGIEHEHEADCALYDPTLAGSCESVYEVKKSFNPVGKSFTVSKAVVADDGSLVVEGWISTNAPDLDKDVVEPECFQGAPLSEYFQRGAPISCEHDMDKYPVGHLQRAVLVRDGSILQEETHPTDPADFLEGPGNGTGWYGRGVVDAEEPAAKKIQKGHSRSFSGVGNLTDYEKMYNGGRRYKAINPLLETTVAAYPVNAAAVMRVVKASGLEEKEEIND